MPRLVGAQISSSSQVLFHGDSITRESLTQNEHLLVHALHHLGTRPSVQACQVNVQALYDHMELAPARALPIHSASAFIANRSSMHFHAYVKCLARRRVFLGNLVKFQAWGLRRMVSIYNDVVCRPHVPRDKGLIRIMKATGITACLDMDANEEPQEVTTEAETGLEENEEEELPTDDELVDLLEGRDSRVIIAEILQLHVSLRGFLHISTQFRQVIIWVSFSRKLMKCAHPSLPVDKVLFASLIFGNASYLTDSGVPKTCRMLWMGGLAPVTPVD